MAIIEHHSPLGSPPPSRGGREILAVAGAVVVAVLTVAAWAVAGEVMRGLDAATFAALVGAAFLAEYIAVPITPRSTFHASTPIVLLTGLIGGPIAGAVAGAVTVVPGLRSGAGWSRSAYYGSLAVTQGLLAGVIGVVTPSQPGRDALVQGVLAAAMFLVTNLSARLIAGSVRGIPWALARPGTVTDVVEAIVAVPFLAVLASSYRESGAPMVLWAIGATLFGLFAFVQAHGSFLRELALERARHAHRVDGLEAENERLRRQARTDALTQIPNRLAYDERLEHAVEYARRHDVHHGLLLVDVDHFKAINTEETHSGGDKVLQAIVERVREGLRSGDWIFRRGGEEFCALVPGVADLDDLRHVAGKVRAFVAALPLRADGLQRQVTVSIGGTIVDGTLDPAQLEELVNRALLVAKQTRNTVHVVPPAWPTPDETQERLPDEGPGPLAQAPAPAYPYA